MQWAHGQRWIVAELGIGEGPVEQHTGGDHLGEGGSPVLPGVRGAAVAEAVVVLGGREGRAARRHPPAEERGATDLGRGGQRREDDRVARLSEQLLGVRLVVPGNGSPAEGEAFEGLQQLDRLRPGHAVHQQDEQLAIVPKVEEADGNALEHRVDAEHLGAGSSRLDPGLERPSEAGVELRTGSIGGGRDGLCTTAEVAPDHPSDWTERDFQKGEERIADPCRLGRVHRPHERPAMTVKRGPDEELVGSEATVRVELPVGFQPGPPEVFLGDPTTRHRVAGRWASRP
ncbi:MAG: hypothetical protein JW751_32045 [Polyangiaceae bacterium]|nr:hypothetical protein [Polyangiaceae bacterium]